MTSSRLRRTWPQRLTIVAVVLAALGAFVAAAGLVFGQWVISNRNVVVLADPADASVPPTTASPIVVSGGTLPSGEPVTDTATDPDAPPETFPEVSPEARNFLVTGADNNSCVDPDSPYAPAFGDRGSLGERSDTIMIWRVNPSTDQVAVLSFPRDLYVEISGGSKSRINAAYRRDDPSRLIETIYANFGIPVDHYIQVDFCAFKRLVDAVGGVDVPFEYPARDRNTGLNVPVSGGECFTFDGDHALAYVRSRKYQYEDPPGSGNWKTDGTSDLGRIARQQDFVRRVVSDLLDEGFTPSVVRGAIDTTRDYLTVDDELTVARMLEFAGILESIEPAEITSYQIESEAAVVAGNAVLLPRIKGDNMQAILAIFRGQARLGDVTEQVFDADDPVAAASEPGPTTATIASAPPDDGGDDATDDDDASAEVADTLPVIEAEENAQGISPPRDVTC